MSNRYTNSNDFIIRSEVSIPGASQTFSKSKTQYPEGFSPLFLEKGKGGRVWDIDGNEYIDLVCGLLAVVLGYCDPDVDKAIINQLSNGITLSLPSKLETILAEKLVEIIPSAEMVRLGKNGSDVTAAAIRLSRAYTGKNHIIALGYHGWQDWYISATTRNKGIPSDVKKYTHRLPFNDKEAITDIFNKYAGDIAGIILEPMNVEEPTDNYLEFLRWVCDEHKSVLIFDEMITGFRYSLGGAQTLFNVTPDLSCFGKAMGNGLPISAVVGKAIIMKEMEEIFFSGTFGGETLSIAAAIAVIDKMQNENVIDSLWDKGEFLSVEVNKLIKEYGLSAAVCLKGKSPWIILNFQDYGDWNGFEIKTLYILEMLKNGILTQGTHNVCYAHDQHDLDEIIIAYRNTFVILREALKHNTEKYLPCPAIMPVFKVR
jgi:glutamate-1-semialdehyde aminotransferase